MSDIVGIGELLVDFTYVSGENGDTFYKQNAGGAPARYVHGCKAGRKDWIYRKNRP